jgi:hypothetical protein
MKVCKSCGDTFSRQDSLTRHINTICKAPDSWTECISCGKYYKDIGNHYYYEPDHRPEISNRQHEIIAGTVMGDGCIAHHETTPRLKVSMINQKYINHLSTELSSIFSSTYKDEKSEYENTQTQYSLTTITHPGLEKYSDWYISGEKVFPNDVTITPLLLKHWYVQDGGIYDKKRYPQIRSWNERENTEKVIKYFDDTPLNASFSSGTIRFPNCKDLFFDYIGEPVPGFERKWPNGEV